ncbi:hypothetical protein LTR10_013754 [Elasticomyces elasticus]|uniref:Uncharacterized protein n=1 Tax=Exophiala sideris TaxID=1016849 RepID=A0ABR0JHC3_9EURO|nr:hypothetical protein LTR10_013754 [Elasticomyces elasticus]KAK5033270.1 hypothetical protein LTS07_003571 [Exophiala sideris]KAK5042233.1 hypothetical protein LTR13_002039 [Exophiala sideris]KAK5063814.1 hypothetical protein LTR69_003579 [Exophiala sideris]KAK5185501.1 hypothetical protein LTR44_002490 [Eurotiomycetes sp. CCFEE 6388]
MVIFKIRTGQQMLDEEKDSLEDYRMDQNLVRRVDSLVPGRYTAGPNAKSEIRRVLERVTKFVHETCPAGLKRPLLPGPDTLFEKCRVLGGFIPVQHFPPSGHVLDRFLKGVIAYLEEHHRRVGTAVPPGDSRQSDTSVANMHAPPQPTVVSEPEGAQLPTPATPGTSETSPIKIESDTEAGVSPGLRRSSRKKASLPRKPNKATKKRRRDGPSNTKESDATHDNAQRARYPPMKRAKPSSNHRASSPVVDLTPQRTRTDVDRVSTQLRKRLNVTPQEQPSRIRRPSEPESSEESDSSHDHDYTAKPTDRDGAQERDRGRAIRDNRRRKPLNVYQAIYEEAQEEIRFLQGLLIKGAGLTEADLQASKVRVRNGLGFKYAFEFAYYGGKEAMKEPSAKRARISM